MRIAISAENSNGLDSVVGPHFGRCPYYVLVDVDGQDVRQVDAVENPHYAQHVPGAVPGFINGHRADVMLTGGMGRRAIGLFQQYGIEAVTGASGTVRHALEQYLGGGLQGAAPCCGASGDGHSHESGSRGGGCEEGEVGRLREEASLLQRQLAEVAERLDRLAPGL